MTAFLKYQKWDMVLCILASFAFAASIAQGFYATQDLSNWVWPFALGSLVFIPLMTIASYDRRTAIIGAVTFVAALALFLIACARMHPETSVLDDSDVNSVPYLVVISLASCAFVYLLSRRKWPALIMLVVGIMALELIEYLYFKELIAYFCIFLVASISLFAYRLYQRNLIGSESSTLAFGSTTGVALIASALAVLLALGASFGVIAALHPDRVEMKLIMQRLRIEEEKVRSISSEISILGNTFTLNTDNTTQESLEDLRQKAKDGVAPDTTTSTSEVQSTANSTSGLDNPGETEAEAVTLEETSYVIAAACILAFLVPLMVILTRLWMRKRKWGKIEALAPTERVKTMFLFFISSFRKMGIDIPENVTLAEFARDFAPTFQRFESYGPLCEFQRIIGTYEKTVYGGQEAQIQDIAMFEHFHKYFYDRSSIYVGRLKYIPLFFRI